MPSKDVFAKRERGLENEFFYRVDQELIRKLKEKADSEKGRDQLRQVTGISDEPLLHELLEAGIRAEMLVALTLVPLVQVAWADRKMDSHERDAILEAAADSGLVKNSASFQLLTEWLHQKPSEELFTAWKHYVQELAKTGKSGQIQQLHDKVTRRAREVAQRAGGILGFGRISKAEELVLSEIERAFEIQNETGGSESPS